MRQEGQERLPAHTKQRKASPTSRLNPEVQAIPGLTFSLWPPPACSLSLRAWRSCSEYWLPNQTSRLLGLSPSPRNGQMHKQNLARTSWRSRTSRSQWIPAECPDLMERKGQSAQFPIPPLPGMSVLFNRVRSFKRDAHGALGERGDTCPVRQIS